MAIVQGENVSSIYLGGIKYINTQRKCTTSERIWLEPGFAAATTDSPLGFGNNTWKSDNGEYSIVGETTQAIVDSYNNTKSVKLYVVMGTTSTHGPTSQSTSGTFVGFVRADRVKISKWGGKLALLYTMVKRFAARKAVVAWQ